MSSKKRNIYVLAIIFAVIDIAIGYFLTRLWFFIFKSSIFAGTLFLLTWGLTGYHALYQFFWAKKKIDEL